MSKRWFTSDIHFGHANIIKYQAEARGRFSSVDEMDDYIIKQWNKVVKKGDLVYIIGDFSFYRDMEINKDILARLVGRKILIRGNHDLATTKEYIDAGFEDVRDELIIKLSNNKPFLLKHYPYEKPWWKMLLLKVLGKLGPWKKHYAYYPVNKGLWLIHGHHHSAPRVIGKEINVNTESWDYKLVPEEVICKISN